MPVGVFGRAVQVVQQGGGTNDWVAGEGQLFFQGEYPCAVAAGVGTGKQEDRLELAQFLGQPLHGAGGQAAGIVEHRQTIAGQRPFGKHIQLPVLHGAHSCCLWWWGAVSCLGSC